MKITLLISFVCCMAAYGTAQLQLDQIMKGPGFVGALPEAPEWSLDGQLIYYTKKFPESLQTTYFAYHVSTAKTSVLTPTTWQERWVWNAAAGPLNHMRMQQEQFQFYDLQTKQVKKYSCFANDIWNLQVQNKAQTVVFQQGQSLFVFDLQNGLAKNLVSYQKSLPAKRSSDGLPQTELEFFESVRKQELQSTKFDLPAFKFITFDQQGALQIDPTAHYVLLKEEQQPEEKPTEVPHYIAADAHVFNEKSRAKVQNEEPSQTLYLHDLQTDTLVVIDFSQLSQLNKEDRELIFHPAIFVKTKPLALLDIRSADNKDRWLVCIDLATHQIQELEHQHDSAWIGGPGISLLGILIRALSVGSKTLKSYIFSLSKAAILIYTP